ncbi:Protein of unknown function DUF1666, partial [Dillenia turbinata]
SPNAQVVDVHRNFELVEFQNQNQSASFPNFTVVLNNPHEHKVQEFWRKGLEDHSKESTLHEDDTIEDSYEDTSLKESSFSSSESNSPSRDEKMDDFLSSVCDSNSPPRDLDINDYSPSICSSNLPMVNRNQIVDEREEEVFDPFYKKYTERMRWFDTLNYDRTSGISAILNKQLGTSPSSFESIRPNDFSIPCVSWDKMSRKRLIRSLESDFELVYVAQSCLSWEALYHQYRKLEALSSSGSPNGFFYNNVAEEFQNFHILLERFMEDERLEGKRFWNFIQGRLTFKSLLQVPEVSVYAEEEKEREKGEGMNAREVLKVVEKCINVYWEFVNLDNKKTWWKPGSLFWTNPPVEDPRDLEQLLYLKKRLQKKGLLLKDLQQKKKCWVRRAIKQVGETQEREMLHTMIDMKLVSRVLKMPIISSSHIEWCQEKLNGIEFKDGNVIRTCTSPLFPPS